MLTTPCKLHLILLQPNERCPACGWPAGDHKTHPSNAPKPETSRAEQIQNAIALFIKVDGEPIIVSRRATDELKGTLELRIYEHQYELHYVPLESLDDAVPRSNVLPLDDEGLDDDANLPF